MRKEFIFIYTEKKYIALNKAYGVITNYIIKGVAYITDGITLNNISYNYKVDILKVLSKGKDIYADIAVSSFLSDIESECINYVKRFFKRTGQINTMFDSKRKSHSILPDVLL